MKRTLRSIFVALAILAVTPFALAQDAAAERERKSAEVLTKMRQVDLLNQILPVALTKAQIEKILPVIEKCRQLVKQTEIEEAGILASLDKRLTETVKAGIEKQDVPNKEYLAELAKAYTAMGDKRRKVATANVIAATMAFTEACNKGQQKTAGNSLNPRYIDPSLKLEELTDAQRLQYWIQDVLLDPRAYDLLVKMAKFVN